MEDVVISYLCDLMMVKRIPASLVKEVHACLGQLFYGFNIPINISRFTFGLGSSSCICSGSAESPSNIYESCHWHSRWWQTNLWRILGKFVWSDCCSWSSSFSSYLLHWRKVRLWIIIIYSYWSPFAPVRDEQLLQPIYCAFLVRYRFTGKPSIGVFMFRQDKREILVIRKFCTRWIIKFYHI